MSIKVFKFGGASVKNAEGFINVFDIIHTYGQHNILVVVSAMGKMTNALETVFRNYIDSSETVKLKDLMNEVMDLHKVEINKLGLDADAISQKMDFIIQENEEVILNGDPNDKSFIYDQIVSFGELFSTTILQEYFVSQGKKSVWLDARKLIKTDDSFQEAKVNFELSTPLIKEAVSYNFEENQFIITQGFISSTSDNRTTTLGREGSDYTAAILAYSIDAKELTIWKDVPGILTADPRRFDNVEKLSKLSYSEAIEMTYYGAKVIHPKTIRPIQNKNIRLNVKSFIDPEGKGTTITSDGLLNYPPLVVIQDDMMLMQIFTKDFTFIAEDHLSEIFSKLKENRIKLSVMRNSAISFTICIKNPGDEKLQNFMDDLGDNFSFETFKNLQLITVRYFQDALINSLTKNKVVLFEETMKYTIQLVVKPSLELIEKTN